MGLHCWAHFCSGTVAGGAGWGGAGREGPACGCTARAGMAGCKCTQCCLKGGRPHVVKTS